MNNSISAESTNSSFTFVPSNNPGFLCCQRSLSADHKTHLFTEIEFDRGYKAIGLAVAGWCRGEACSGRLILYIRNRADGDILRVAYGLGLSCGGGIVWLQFRLA